MNTRSKIQKSLVILVILSLALINVQVGRSSTPLAPTQETAVAKYFDDRDGAMALNYDTELYLCGMIHSWGGYDPSTAAARAQETRLGWPNIIDDSELYNIPMSFNICGYEAVFGDTGISEVSSIDLYHTWHPDSHWSTNTWYSDMPTSGGDYTMTGDLSGYTRSYSLIYGGDLTERAMNSEVPFEISYHNFGHESLSDISSIVMSDAFNLGVTYHKRIGSKLTAEAPPWNNNPTADKYPIYVDHGIFVFNRNEGAQGEPYEVIENLWIVPRSGYFTASTDLTSQIDYAITNGTVLAHYSHPEDGFESSNRTGFQTSLAYAREKVNDGSLWATTLSEIGRYWEAKSDVNAVTTQVGDRVLVDITLTDYDVATFGIPYLTFRSTMPDSSSYAVIEVDYPSALTLNSESDTVRVEGGEAVYTIYLNPTGTTHVEIDGVDTPFTGGVDINTPSLSISSTPPVDALEGSTITIQANTDSIDEIYSVNLIYQCNGGAKASSIMMDNGGVWEAEIGPFDGGDIIQYYASVTDNSGRREVTADQEFLVLSTPDVDPPIWRNQVQSHDTPEVGQVISLSAEGWDEVALRSATLETDETGSWERVATAFGSPLSMGDVAETWSLSQFTWVNPGLSASTTISWRIYYQDAEGNESVTDTMSFTLQAASPDPNPPEFFDASTDSTTAGAQVEFRTRWTDIEGLDGYIFSFDNGTGTFIDDPFTEFTEAIGGTWWDADWPYRRLITINHTAGTQDLSNHAVLVTLDTASLIAAGKMNQHGGDIRFIQDGQELDYWVESGLNTASTRIWVEIPEILAGQSEEILMYYGNPNRRVPQSDGKKTFPVFDDFGGRGWEEFKYSGNPVMGPGSPAGGGGVFSSVIRENDTLWRMYASYDSDNRDIGLSTSTDGIAWTHQGVVLRKGASGEWDANNVWCPGVWKEDDTYYMLYAGQGSTGIQMGLATSFDGVNFTKHIGNPVFNDPNWATGDTEGPCFSVLKEGGTYYVMYNTLGSHRRSSVVSSTNLTNWTPVYNYPRFVGGTSTAAWDYNNFCGNVFKFEDLFYLVLPGQDDSRNYAKFGLYVSSSPEFPEDDTEFKGIIMVGNPTGWEAEDMDTPWSVLFSDTMYMYYAACGNCWSQTGMILVDDIPLALAQAYPPGNYIEVIRSATPSQQIMPPVGWEKSISGYEEVDSQNFLVTLDPAMTGRSIMMVDGNATQGLQLYKAITSMQYGEVSAWMRSDNNNSGDFDIYLSGDSGAQLAIAAGLGRNGQFHYWDGASFVDTGVAYAADTWYRVQVAFDSNSETYDFIVLDSTLSEVLRLEELIFAHSITGGIDQAMLYTSTTFNGNAHLDDVYIRPNTDTTPPVMLGTEEDQIYLNAWARSTKTITSTIGTTVRWRYSARDLSGNWVTSDLNSLITTEEDTPPELTLNYPDDNLWSESATTDFSATCSDTSDISSLSLYGDWGGSWSLIDTANGPGINGTEVVFRESVPDGSWTWNVECVDDTGNHTWGTARTLHVDSEPDPWWDTIFRYRQRMIAHENSGHLLSDYPLYAELDTAELIAYGNMQDDCDDIRVTYNGVEVPSQVTGCNSGATRIWLQTDLLPDESRHGFYLYYGHPGVTAPDYSAQSDITWDNNALTMNSGKITATFFAPGGVIGQIKNNVNNTDVMQTFTERGLGYLFSENSSVWYIFRADETDDSIALTEDGPIVKIVTSYSGEMPQWTQESIFYNNQDFVDFSVHRPTTSTDRYLTGANNITPDGVFSTADTNELLRVDDDTTDTTVVFNEVWRYASTSNRGYVGLVDPSFTNELGLFWDESATMDFTWKPRTGSGQEGTYSLFIGGNGTLGQYGRIDTDTFDYRFLLRYNESPDNANSQAVYDYAITDPPTVTFGPLEDRGEDITPPTVTITSPENITYQTDTIPLTFTTSEPVKWCRYTLNGGAPVDVPNCDDSELTGLSNGDYELILYVDDYADLTGSDTVQFSVDVQTFGWWNVNWHFRIPITIDTEAYSRTNEPIEQEVNFTQLFNDVMLPNLILDSNSIRVVEYSAAGELIGEVPSQFDPSASFDPASNAVGSVVWIMSGTTDAHATRHYYIYFDCTAYPKSPPSYSTDLDWNGSSHVLSNTSFDLTLGSVTDSLTRTGINTLVYNGVTYTASPGIYYFASGTTGAPTYNVLVDGPVKKTIQLTPAGPPARGTVRITLYDLAESIKAEGTITSSQFSFTVFPYAHGMSPTVLSNQAHYYNGGTLVNESVASNGWLGDALDEGWACYDGLSSYKDFCLVTDASTLSTTNNFWRHAVSTRQLIFPAWNPNITFPFDAVSWIVMGDTYQDGRDFWNKLGAPITVIQDPAETNFPTAALLASFEAESGLGGILLRWETILELDLLGFNVYRSESLNGQRTMLNDELIPARGTGEQYGASYTFLDRDSQAGVTYYYWLEAVGISVPIPLNEPVSITSPYFLFLPVSIK